LLDSLLQEIEKCLEWGKWFLSWKNLLEGQLF